LNSSSAINRAGVQQAAGSGTQQQALAVTRSTHTHLCQPGLAAIRPALPVLPQPNATLHTPPPPQATTAKPSLPGVTAAPARPCVYRRT
jgi:hypothetical protein